MISRRYDIFDDEENKMNQNPTLDDLCKYQRHHMEMLKNFESQIILVDKLLNDCRQERIKFFMEDLPAIRKKLTEEHIDKSVQDEWLIRLQKAMEHSFDESEKLATAFAVQKADEFREAMEEKLKGI